VFSSKLFFGFGPCVSIFVVAFGIFLLLLPAINDAKVMIAICFKNLLLFDFSALGIF
jgi:hypothetical protein